ncbi:cation:proton antiporter [Actinospongicola halichondriae]|uniref:cation:proton antiporter n=1 Tax=Actinospongicola halichondriae TaxID=3236844 RepID=UPI003D51A582
MAALTVLALAVLAHALVSQRLRSTVVSAPMIFVAVGLLTGPQALDLARIDLGSEEVIVLAELTLSIVLFSDAVRVDPRMARSFVGIPARMLGLGLPMVIGFGTVIARVALGLEWAEAALLASILGATDAALGQAVLTDDSVPGRIRSSLNVESGLNDGLALPAVTLFTAITAAESGARPPSYWIRFVAEQIGFGIAAGAVVGIAAGWLLVRARRASWVDGVDGQLAALAQVGLAFVLAHEIGGNTFIAAFVAGLAFRFIGRDDAEYLCEFTEDGGQLFASITFVVFGNALLGPALGALTIPIAVCVVATLTIGRMIPIAVSLVGTGLRAPTVVFLGWFGPRGLASILFALTVIEGSDREVDDTLFVVVAWAVLSSVVIHGATASWGARHYGAWFAAHRAATHDQDAIMEDDPDGESPVLRPRWTPRPSPDVSD